MSPLLWLGRMPQRLATPSTVVVASGDSLHGGASPPPPAVSERGALAQAKKTPRSPFEPRGVFFRLCPLLCIPLLGGIPLVGRPVDDHSAGVRIVGSANHVATPASDDPELLDLEFLLGVNVEEGVVLFRDWPLEGPQGPEDLLLVLYRDDLFQIHRTDGRLQLPDFLFQRRLRIPERTVAILLSDGDLRRAVDSSGTHCVFWVFHDFSLRLRLS